MNTTTISTFRAESLVNALCNLSLRWSPVVAALFMWSIWHAYERAGTANNAGLFDLLLGALIMALSLPGVFAGAREWRLLINVTLAFVGLNILAIGLFETKTLAGLFSYAGKEIAWYVGDAASHLSESVLLGTAVFVGGYVLLAGLFCLAAMFFWHGAFQGEGYEGRRFALRMVYIVIVLGLVNQPILGLLF
ncbi:hypothetical protein [Phytopseudomonas daroniae]|uniref:hypothetical protein n=1 Tax=Phytopseudomonas daroniae TaxID=2487519 RepID=UPI001038537F|nr:hypothetical protein [Pseudomonas daroniae]TBU77182.1 hypothetical protein DNK10_06645 [Pseudomonas daroniae]